MTASFGIRVDAVRRYDEILGIQRMKSTEFGPRFGVSYMVTKDAKNVLRFSAARMHDMMNGADVVESFATTSRVTTRDVYIDKNGVQTTVITPPPTAALSALQFDKGLHQPYVDEYIVGFRKQFPGQFSLDVSGRRRYYKDQYGLVDINGIYPSGPDQPFGGFGLVDPNRGILYQERNNNWSQPVVTALEAVVAKNMSHNVQAMVSCRANGNISTARGTRPTRRASSNRMHFRPIVSSRRQPGTGTRTPWMAAPGRRRPSRDSAIRDSGVGQYLAPWGITLAGSYEVAAGDYTAPIVTRLAAADPRFGPALVTLANGTKQPNPLATTIRFAYPTRGEGSVLNEPPIAAAQDWTRIQGRAEPLHAVAQHLQLPQLWREYPVRRWSQPTVQPGLPVGDPAAVPTGFPADARGPILVEYES